MISLVGTIWALSLGLGSLLALFFYVKYYQIWEREWRVRARDQSDLIAPHWTAGPEAVLTHRDPTMVQVGAIFIAGAFLLLYGGVTIEKQPYITGVLASTAVVLYGFWLFAFQLSTRLMHDSQAEMLLTMRHPNRALHNLLREFYEPAEGANSVMVVRRNFWAIVLPMIGISSSLIIFSKF